MTTFYVFAEGRTGREPLVCCEEAAKPNMIGTYQRCSLVCPRRDITRSDNAFTVCDTEVHQARLHTYTCQSGARNVYRTPYLRDTGLFCELVQVSDSFKHRLPELLVRKRFGIGI